MANCSSSAWHHVAMTVKNMTRTLYIDGVQAAQNVAAALPTYSDGNGMGIGCFHYSGNIYPCYSDINDFRIYDHALSTKEVKEIAKGLVLHYPLSRGVENILSNTNINSIDNFGFSEQTGGSTKEVVYDNGVPCVKITRNSTAHSGWAYLWATTLQHSKIKTGTTYTVSFDAKASAAGSIGLSGFMNGNATNQLSDSSTVINGLFAADTWTHLVFRTTTKSSFDGLSVGGQCVYMSCGLLNATGAWLMTKNFKVEEGTKDTPWIPATTDTAYSVMGYDKNIEYDCSGYKRNGTKDGTVTYTADTPRYSTATNFAASSGIFAYPNITFSSFTIAFWGKHVATGKMLMGSLASLTNTNSYWYWYGDNSFKYPDGEFYYAHNAGTAEALLGKWTHFVATYDGNVVTVYRNGINEGTKALTGTQRLEYLSVGCGFSNSSYWAGGCVSDFRIYATALSAEDIKELYDTPVSIADNGTMLTQGEFVEN